MVQLHFFYHWCMNCSILSPPLCFQRTNAECIVVPSVPMSQGEMHPLLNPSPSPTLNQFQGSCQCPHFSPNSWTK